jgi:aryl-alcohol dehydrogenase-like predicted oxidoreductase
MLEGIELQASRIGLGTWAMGGWMWGGTDEKESVRAIHASLDKGVNLIDTAPVYGFGKSEEIVGKAIAEFGHRERVIIATKAGLEWKDGQIRRNSSERRILQEVDDSLRRLRTDHIDIYQVHWPDLAIPIQETAQTMNQLRKQGKIKAIGVSNYSVGQMDLFRRSSPLHICQPPYNLFERDAEDAILPYCQQHDISILGYGALCRGLLSGKMTKDSKFKGDDLRKMDPKFKMPRYQQYLKAVQRLDKFARDNFDKSVIHLAVRWVLDQGVDAALWGARRPEQIEPFEEATGWALDDDARKVIDRIVRETIKDPAGPEFMAPPAGETKSESTARRELQMVKMINKLGSKLSGKSSERT